jgi:hypothetical protein
MTAKLFVAAVLDKKLRAIGIKGEYRYKDCDKDGNGAMLSDIQFEDEKDRFIYELHGGQDLWDCVWDELLEYMQQKNETIKENRINAAR